MKKKEGKVLKAAKAAKAEGYEYMASLVYEYYTTKYYNCVPINKIIENGKWIPKHICFKGTTRAKLPEKTIFRKEALQRYCK